MIILLVLLLIASLWGMKISSFHKDYMSLDATSAIKGIFAVLILFSHMRQYMDLSDTFFNNSYIRILNYLGQMMVTMYLFYSGYGLMESFRKKPDYKKNFLHNRVLKILIHFDVAVILYIILQFLLGKQFHISEYLGSLIGWNTVGNSSWFIFDILALYVIFYLSLCIEKWLNKSNKKIESGRVILVTVLALSIALWCGLYITKGGSRWINNIMSFPLGIFYSMYKAQIENWISKGRNYYVTFLTLTVTLFVWRSYMGIDKIGVCTSLFAIWTVLLTMKIKFNNKALQWLGTMAFAIFILQRLPMIALTYFGINQNVCMFVCVVILSTLIISQLYTSFLRRIDKHLFK